MECIIRSRTIPSLVPADWLVCHLADPDVVVVDCRFDLFDPKAALERFRERHILGASRMDMETELSGSAVTGARHPLPTRERFTAAARRAGISRKSRVVAYDENMTGGAARLWWLLRHFGHGSVGILENGLDAWGGPVSVGDEARSCGDFAILFERDDAVDRENVKDHLGEPDRLLLDARDPERYCGVFEPFDSVAGHIPGAVNAPKTSAFPELTFSANLDKETVVYCGSGVSACVIIFALFLAGNEDAKLYAGSWSEWASLGEAVALGCKP